MVEQPEKLIFFLKTFQSTVVYPNFSLMTSTSGFTALYTSIQATSL